MVDTRNKRASVLGFGLASLLVLPVPDAVIGQDNRQHVAYSYAGISALQQHISQIDVGGSYTPLIDVGGSYTPTIDVSGGLE